MRSAPSPRGRPWLPALLALLALAGSAACGGAPPAPEPPPASEAPEPEAEPEAEPEPEPEPEPPAEPLDPIRSDRTLQILSSIDDPRAALTEAGDHLGDWTIELAGVAIDGDWLRAVASAPLEEPILRVVREAARRPIDLTDFLYFLDDVLLAGQEGRRGEPFHITSGRARAAGILIHPDDVFRDRPRRYGRSDTLHVDRPLPQASHPPAQDGDPPGPGWTMRYLNPDGREAHFQALREERPGSDFADRIEALLSQIEAQGGETWVTSTVRRPERGYLMWGAFILDQASTEEEVERTARRLDRANADWGLNIPITWRHPDGWRATLEAARQMKDAYDVVYATERGARYSNHYGGRSADFVALGLPRSLTLKAPDGTEGRFDLSDPSEPRDLSLSPELIRWVERHFQMTKLESDYPHWTDARP